MKGITVRAPSTGRRRTRDEIRSILEWQRQSGLSLLAFARKQGLCYSTLLRWRAVHEPAVVAPDPADERQGGQRSWEPSPRLVPIQLEEVRSENFIFEWAPGRSLRIPAGFDPSQLRRLLEVLGVQP